MAIPRPRSLCDERDIRNVVSANDTQPISPYARSMKDRTRREHTMKRIAAILAAAVAIGIVPSVAAAGNGSTTQVKTQVTAQVKIQRKTQQATAQVVAQRVSPAISAQRISTHKAYAARFTRLLSLRAL
jgi:hypothetical protein